MSDIQRAYQQVTKSYNELLMAVARKFPGESRHETALRYIQQAERSTHESGSGAQCERGVYVEFIGGPKNGIVMTKTLMRDLFRMAKDNKIRRVLVVLEK